MAKDAIQFSRLEEIINQTTKILEEKENDPQFSSFLKTTQEDRLLKTCRQRLEEELSRLELFKTEKIDSYNDQYKQYLIDRIDLVCNSCELFNEQSSRIQPYAINRFLSDVKNLANRIGEGSDFDLLRNFRYGDSNYVLFGKNGSGKTTLINQLHERMFSVNAVVMPATRSVNYEPNPWHQGEVITFENAFSTTDQNKDLSLFILSQLVIRQELKERRENVSDSLLITSKITKAFRSLGIERELCFGEDGLLQLKADANDVYQLASASDGEKSAAYFLMAAFLAPKNYFLIIDEPENHLNGSLMKKLFDILEDERKDLKFVYATHNISFIESRRNSEIIYLRKTKAKGKFEFNEFKNYGDLTLDTILNVEGTNDDVLFCEGEEDGSLDNKIYRSLYPNYQVISSNGCDKVKSRTIVLNENTKELRKKAFGIIDNDFSDADHIEKLKTKSVFTLKVNEIENVLMLEDCLKKAIDYLDAKISVNDLKAQIIENIKTAKKTADIKQDYANKLIRRIQLDNKISDADDLRASLDTMNIKNNEKIANDYSAFEKKFNEAIANSDYESLMKYVPGKFVLDYCAKRLGLKDKAAYARILLKIMDSDEEMRNSLKKQICDLE